MLTRKRRRQRLVTKSATQDRKWRSRCRYIRNRTWTGRTRKQQVLVLDPGFCADVCALDTASGGGKGFPRITTVNNYQWLVLVVHVMGGRGRGGGEGGETRTI